jgi:AcrR family transcriptional regulator
MATFPWTEQTEKAAELLAVGELTVGEIAEAAGVSRQTIYNWRDHPEFKARVDDRLEEIRREIRRVGIADQLRRVHALNDRWNKMKRVIEARGADPTMAECPGGDTGLMVRTIKKVVLEDDTTPADEENRPRGPRAVEVAEYAVDTGLLKELRDHEKQAAQELGQWLEKQQVSGADGGPLVVLKLGRDGMMDEV